MKRFSILLLSFSMFIIVSACTNQSTTSPSKADTSSQEQDILIAYFSWSGNTEKMANMIQEETGGDLFKIEPVETYTDDYDTLLDQVQQELNDNVRPDIANVVNNWDDYEVIFVGYPTWWDHAPMVMLSFVESYDWEGKTLIPFNTSGGSGFGNSLESIESSASGANILKGLSLDGDTVEDSQNEVKTWISELGL